MKFYINDTRHRQRGKPSGRDVEVGEVKAFREDECNQAGAFGYYVMGKGITIEADDRRDAVDKYLQLQAVMKRLDEGEGGTQ